MPGLTNNIAEVPAFMAIQFKGIAENGGWVTTTQAVPEASTYAGTTDPYASLAISTDPSLGAPNRASYSELREYQCAITRDFEGINSSGGPQTAVRGDHADVTITRESDRISPLLFEYLCTGQQLAWVHIVRINTNANRVVHVRLQDVQVVGFDFSAIRVMGERPVSTGSDVWEEFTRSIRNIDVVRFLYTTRHLKVGGTDRGWNTGSNSP